MRTHPTMSRSLDAMADWLVESGVTLAGMESTATYWKPVFYALEDRMGTWLLNAAHLKADRLWLPRWAYARHCRVESWSPPAGRTWPVRRGGRCAEGRP